MCPEPIFLNVHLYGVMIAIGILACFFILYFFGKIKGVNPAFTDFVFYNGIASIAVGFFTANLFQAIYNYIDNPDAGFTLKNSGITFIGGLLGGIVTFLLVYLIFRKKVKGKLTDIVSIAPCCILIAHAFGRVGCFFAGCCYGKETNSFLGVKFPDLPHAVHPTMLYEAIFLFALFAICSILLIKFDFKHNLSVYLVAYGLFRFLIEYLRGDFRGGFIPGISPSQFWSLLMIIGGIVLYFGLEFYFKKQKTKPTEPTENN